MSDRVMLTTVDNPFNPFTQFDEWLAFDIEQGYDSCCLLARIANTSSELPENLNDLIVEQAIDEICLQNVNGLYRKVNEKGEPVPIKYSEYEDNLIKPLSDMK